MSEPRYTVLSGFTAQTAAGPLPLKTGDIVTLPEDLALRLVNDGKLWPVGRVAIRVYSEVLEGYLWLAATDADAQALQADETIVDGIYTMEEVEELKDKPREHLKAVDNAKRAFPNSKIIKKRGKKK